jgi:hypothetical protein
LTVTCLVPSERVIDPSAVALSPLPADRQTAVALQVAEAAVARAEVDLEQRDPASLAAQVQALDEVAWGLQETGSGYESAFARARAANAVLFAVQAEPADAVYEAVAAVGDDAFALAIIGRA